MRRTVRGGFTVVELLVVIGIVALVITAASPAVLQKTMNSTNHDGEGQNVLFNDGHVEWAATAWVGAHRDNIYTRAKTMQTPEGLAQADPPASDPEGFPEPALEMDTVLLPVFPGAAAGAPDRKAAPARQFRPRSTPRHPAFPSDGPPLLHLPDVLGREWDLACRLAHVHGHHIDGTRGL